MRIGVVLLLRIPGAMLLLVRRAWTTGLGVEFVLVARAGRCVLNLLVRGRNRLEDSWGLRTAGAQQKVGYVWGVCQKTH
jgi:hypothetical protein